MDETEIRQWIAEERATEQRSGVDADGVPYWPVPASLPRCEYLLAILDRLRAENEALRTRTEA